MWLKSILNLFKRKKEMSLEERLRLLDELMPTKETVKDPYWNKYIGGDVNAIKRDFPDHIERRIGDNKHIKITVNNAWHVFVTRGSVCIYAWTFPDDADNYKPMGEDVNVMRK